MDSTSVVVCKDFFQGIFSNLVAVNIGLFAALIAVAVCVFGIKYWLDTARMKEVAEETAQKRTAAVNKGFEMMFNEDYSAIRIESFDNIIYYYANRSNKLKRMTAKNVAQYYYENYKDEIVKMLEEMKICIINRKYNDWADCVNAFCKKYQKS